MYTVGTVLKGRFVPSLQTKNRVKAFDHGKKLATLQVVGIITDDEKAKTYHVHMRPTKGFYIERIS